MRHNLTDKQKAFVREYLLDLNATQAAIRAGVTLEPKPPETGWYMYFLIDPRDDTIFYVGKGKGKRVWQHLSQPKNDRNHVKARRIEEIRKNGVEPVCRVFESFKEEGAAFNCEKEMISSLRSYGLTNLTGGMCAAKERMRDRAKSFKDRLPAFARTLQNLNPAGIAAVNAVFGSTTDCYYAIEKAIENEINEPTPNVITFKPGEGVVFGWE